mgnify:FL=1
MKKEIELTEEVGKKEVKKAEVKSYKVLKAFLADKQYNVNDIYHTSNNADFLKNNKYIK